MVGRAVRGAGLVLGSIALISACGSTGHDVATPPTLPPTSQVFVTTTTSPTHTGTLSLEVSGTTRARDRIPTATCTVAPKQTTVSGQSADGTQFTVLVANPAAGAWALSNKAGEPQVQHLTVVVGGKDLGSPVSGNISIDNALGTHAQLTATYGSGKASQDLTASWACKA